MGFFHVILYSVKRTAFKPRKTKLRIVGVSDVAETKRNIQNLVRQIVMKRDGGCVLRDYIGFELPPCGGYAKDGHQILQADHLISRSNAATYADSRLVVCVCKSHHGWKSVGSNLRKKEYDRIVRAVLPKDRVDLWDRCEADAWRPKRTGAYDWKMAELALIQELKQYD